MPGFPIRTSSDQRFIDNSPRLNAALHVLHRLSMPRHPPCALNNEHTTNTQTPPHKVAVEACWRELHKTQKNRNHTNHTPTTQPTPQKERGKLLQHGKACGLMLASTIQFSHNTPHQPHNQQQTWLHALRVGYNQGIMPQTPNNAPSTSLKTCQSKRVNHSWIVNHSWLRCISTRFT